MVNYTNPVMVTDYKITDTIPRNPNVGGYGKKIPTQYMLKYFGKWRRVYCVCYSNSGSIYVNVNGQWEFIDSATEYKLENLNRWINR